MDALVARTRDAFRKAMDDDFGTDDAVYRLIQMTTALAEIGDLSPPEGREVVDAYRECGQVLGLFQTVA